MCVSLYGTYVQHTKNGPFLVLAQQISSGIGNHTNNVVKIILKSPRKQKTSFGVVSAAGG